MESVALRNTTERLIYRFSSVNKGVAQTVVLCACVEAPEGQRAAQIRYADKEIVESGAGRREVEGRQGSSRED